MLDIDCLSKVVYHEARGEPILGQQTVAHVVLNRAERWKRPICAIVYAPSQFSWTSKVVSSPFGSSWLLAKEIAGNLGPDPTGGALYFHNTSVHPSWANKKQFTVQIGRHKFYK